MNMQSALRRLGRALIVATFMLQACAFASDFPSKPVKIVVPYPPGGSVDFAARLLGGAMSQHLGQPVVVDNRPGASGIVGTTALLASKADDHTFLLAATAVMAVVPHTVELRFSPLTDLLPVGKVADTIGIVTASASNPANNFDEFIANALAGKREVRYGYVGVGTITQLVGEMLRVDTGMNMLSVPYKGNADEINAMLAGDIDLVIDPTAIGQILGGKLKALAVTTPQRIAALPNTPTLNEGKYKISPVPSWLGLFAPKGTSPQAIQRMSTELQKALADPANQAKLERSGLVHDYVGPTEFGAMVRHDHEFYRKLIRTSNLKLQ